MTDVTVVSRVRTVDNYGDTTVVESQTLVPGCEFAPESAPKARANPDEPEVTVQARVYMPAGTAVDPDDHLLVEGDRYLVVGRPERWPEVVVVVHTWEQQ